MRRRRLLAGLVFLISLGFFGGSGAQAAGTCQDRDGDGYGTNCCMSSECKDSDPSINGGSLDICDNKDNDCNSLTLDGNAESGYSCTTGLPGVCSAGTIQCVADATNPTGKGLKCVANTAASPEVCDCKDNNCDGRVDEGCPDADGDGYATGCDCNDADPSIHPGAEDICGDNIDQDCDGNVDNRVTGSDGKLFCAEILPIQLFSGVSQEFGRVRVAHEQGVYSIDVIEDDDGIKRTYFCQQPSCLMFFPVANHGDTRLINVAINKCDDDPNTPDLECTNGILTPPGGTPYAQKYFAETVSCEQEYCGPDPQIGGFLDWMRAARYPECAVSKYLELSQPIDQRVRQKNFLRVRFNRASDINYNPVNFYDILQSATQGVTITQKPMGPFDGDTCNACDSWPDWCPSTLSATEKQTNYLFVKRLYEKTFAMPFTFNYQSITLDYFTSGIPISFSTQPPGYFINYSPVFMSQFPPHSIVHFALQTYNGYPILPFGQGTANGSAETTDEPNDISPVANRGSEVFTHEFGHTWGFHHSQADGVPTLIDPGALGKFVAMDGIMDDSLRGETVLADPLDPLERYALEPSAGYTDAPGFASSYATRLTGTYQLPSCGSVDPAIVSGTIVSTLPNAWVVDLTLKNNGTIPVGYVTLGAYDGSATGRLILERVLGRFAAGETKIHRMTVGNSGFTSQNIVFVLDSANKVTESVESNNTLTVPLPPCVDADGDGFTPICHFCSNVNCPRLDCNDSNPAINPNAVEGPAGSAVCSDTLDNDCDGLIDASDPGCGGPPQPTIQTAVWESTPPTAGTIIQGTYVSTQISDDVREGLKEGGTGSNLIQTWRFDNVPTGTSHQLLIEGYRPSNTDGDDFQFSFFNGPSFDASTVFTDITGAVINYTLKVKGGERTRSYTFGTGAASGTIFIRVRDTAGGTKLDSVYVDYLALQTNP